MSQAELPQGITVCAECGGAKSLGCRACNSAGFLYEGKPDPDKVRELIYRRREKEIAAKIAAGEYDESRDGPVPWQKAIYARCGGVKNLFIATSKEAAEHGKAEVSKQQPNKS